MSGAVPGGTPRFAGRVAIVTGAGAGLGALYVAALAREGAAVVAVDRNGAGAERTAEATRAAGGECRAVTADLAREDEVARMAEAALGWQGHIDVLVNNAGGGSSETASATTLAEEDAASWDALVDANVKTAFLCTRAVAEPMKRARYGRIVNVSSRAARVKDAVVPQSPAYTAAKAGVMGLTRFAARELGPFGVTVNCLVPSLTLSGPRARGLLGAVGRGGAGALPPAGGPAAPASARGDRVGAALSLRATRAATSPACASTSTAARSWHEASDCRVMRSR